MNLEQTIKEIQIYLNTNYNNCNIEIVNLNIGGDYGNSNYSEIDVRFTIVVKDNYETKLIPVTINKASKIT